MDNGYHSVVDDSLVYGDESILTEEEVVPLDEVSVEGVVFSND